MGTDRGLVGVDWHVVHLVEVVVQQALLGVGLDDLAQGLPAQLLWGQSGGKAVHALGRPAAADGRTQLDNSYFRLLTNISFKRVGTLYTLRASCITRLITSAPS